MILFLHSDGGTGASFYPWVNTALVISLGIVLMCLIAGIALIGISLIKDSDKIERWGLKVLVTAVVWLGVMLLTLLTAFVAGWYTTGGGA